jgi:hypothetical protein
MPSHSHPRESRQPSRRMMRLILDITLPLLGTLIVLGVTLLHQELRSFFWVAVGILLVEMCLLRASHRMLPEERKYNALRTQTNQFLSLVRQLNTAALHVKEYDTFENRQVIEEIRAKMLRKVDRLVEVAGKTNGELQGTPLLDQKKTFSGAAF